MLSETTETTTKEHTLLVQRAQGARAQAARMKDQAAALKAAARVEHSHVLVTITDDLDWRRDVSPERMERLQRLSRVVGRDTHIEDAKAELRERYQITGAQAFELLRHISQTSNRKLRDVAQQVLAS